MNIFAPLDVADVSTIQFLLGQGMPDATFVCIGACAGLVFERLRHNVDFRNRSSAFHVRILEKRRFAMLRYFFQVFN